MAAKPPASATPPPATPAAGRAASRPPIEVRATATHFLGMPVADFLRDYWQKAPLLVRQAFPGYVAPLTPEDLAGLACEEAALSRLVQHDRANDAWRVRSGPFDEAEFPALGDRDWTLLVQDMDKWDADVGALLERFRFLPAWRVDDVMISFAAPGGSVGPHVDQYDVFLLQAQGRRRWQVDARADAPRGFRDDVELKLLRHFHPSHDWVLAPGDMLYLPPGVPHHGEAVDACMTFSIGMRAPSHSELLVDLAETAAAALPEEARFTDPDLAPARDAWEIDEAAFARVEAAMAALQALGPAERRAWFGRFITRYRSAGEVMPAPGARGWTAVRRAVDKGGLLQRTPFARIAWSAMPGAGDDARLFVDGEALPMGRDSASVLAASARLDAATLDALDPAGRHAVEQLYSRGYFSLQPAPRTRR